MSDFAGKVVIVTGGVSGIGRAAATLLAARGAQVNICGLNQDEADTVAADIGYGARGYVVDVTVEAQVGAFVSDVTRTDGGLDVVVTAAGIQRYGTAADTMLTEWNEVLSTNLTGSFLAVKHALPYLRERGAGTVVMVSSVQAFITQTDVAAYTASKGALNALARSIAIDEARHGIRVNAVCPGSVDTPMLRMAARRFSDGSHEGEQALIEQWGASHPLGRVARPSEIAEAIAFLASERASFVTGISLLVDGGLSATAPVALPH
jgi:NAD(P)-dependent dehydrogenase (short-subunit alcohol dehydrogenase family)